jgi:AAA15 family ATPase/GTPase
MFTSIDIQNFKGFEKLTVEGLKQFNLVVGDNNSKKTTLLEAIYALAGAPKIDSLLYSLTSRRIKPYTNYYFKSLFFNESTNTPLILSGEDTTRGKINFQVDYFKSSELFQRGVTVNSEYKDGIETKLTGDLISKDLELMAVVKLDENKEDFFRNTNQIQYDMAFQNPFLFDSYSIPICYISTHYKAMLPSLSSVFASIQSNLKLLSSVIKQLRPLCDGLHDIRIGGKDDLLLCVNDRVFPVGLAGDGFERLINLVLRLVATEQEKKSDEIFLVDEIENGFYYKQLPTVWDTLIKTAQAQNTQLFATTHSLECINAYLQQASEVDPDFEKFSIIRMGVDKDGKPAATVFTGERLARMARQGWELR